MPRATEQHQEAFGLRWHSPELEIPELPAYAKAGSADSPAITIAPDVLESCPELPPGPHDTPFLLMGRGNLWLTMEQIGRFCMTSGERMAWHREPPGVDLIISFNLNDVPDPILASYALVPAIPLRFWWISGTSMPSGSAWRSGSPEPASETHPRRLRSTW
jgi:hypothetical protein